MIPAGTITFAGMEFVQVTSTAETVEQAQSIADHLVAHRLAACVQVLGPITSTYRWEGAIERSEEYMCIIKSRLDLSYEVVAAIRSLHPYENPEVVVTPIVAGSADYLQWIAAETAQ